MLSFIYVLYRFMCVHVYIYIYIHTYTHVIIVTVLENLDIFYTGLACAENIDDMKSRPWPHAAILQSPEFLPLAACMQALPPSETPPQEPFYRVLMVLNCGHVGYISG